MGELRKEAQQGTKAVEARNHMLQKNLGNLTVDFEQSSKDLRVSNTKIRELDYELEQMIIELNTKGESLKKSTASNVQLKSNLETTSKGLKDLQKTHEQLILQKSKIEADSRNEKLRLEQQILDLRKNLDTVTTSFEKTKLAKADLEMLLASSNAEAIELKKNVDSLTTERNSLNVTLNRTKNNAHTEITQRDETISELKNKIAKDQVVLKNTQETKEQLLFRVTNLENNLSIESTNARLATDELQRSKRENELKTNSLIEQVEKLNSSKGTLLLDKKDLSEKIKIFRRDLVTKEEELANTLTKLAEVTDSSESKIATLEKDLSTVNENFNNLTKDNRDLNAGFEESIQNNNNVSKLKQALEKKLASIELDLSNSRMTINQYLGEKEMMSNDISERKDLHQDLLNRFNSLIEENTTARTKFAEYKEYAENAIQDRNLEIQVLMFDFGKAKNEIAGLDDSEKRLEKQIAELLVKLEKALKDLDEQTSTREILERQLDENRKEHQYEKKMRKEIERVQMSLKFGESSRSYGSWTDWKNRDKKLQDVVMGLFKESTRLNGLVNLLPKEENGGFGNETEFVWPSSRTKINK
jgi:chromosome segregation ATPase